MNTNNLKSSKEIPLGFLIINGKHIYHLEHTETNIGRSSKNQLLVTDMRVSRLHARITVTGSRCLLTDLNSSAGTFVNNFPIVQKVIQPGDEIRLGPEFTCKYHINRKHLPPNAIRYNPNPENTHPLDQTGNLRKPS